MDKNKLVLSISIIIGCLIIGGFYYATQIEKQLSIESQQRLSLELKREELKTKSEKDDKEYIAKRKSECYEMYLKEKKNWTNVKDFEYSEPRDICLVKYKSEELAKSKEECEDYKPTNWDMSDSLIDMLLNSYQDCLSNYFSKEF